MRLAAVSGVTATTRNSSWCSPKSASSGSLSSSRVVTPPNHRSRPRSLVTSASARGSTRRVLATCSAFHSPRASASSTVSNVCGSSPGRGTLMTLLRAGIVVACPPRGCRRGRPSRRPRGAAGTRPAGRARAPSAARWRSAGSPRWRSAPGRRSGRRRRSPTRRAGRSRGRPVAGAQAAQRADELGDRPALGVALGSRHGQLVPRELREHRREEAGRACRPGRPARRAPAG